MYYVVIIFVWATVHLKTHVRRLICRPNCKHSSPSALPIHFGNANILMLKKYQKMAIL